MKKLTAIVTLIMSLVLLLPACTAKVAAEPVLCQSHVINRMNWVEYDSAIRGGNLQVFFDVADDSLSEEYVWEMKMYIFEKDPSGRYDLDKALLETDAEVLLRWHPETETSTVDGVEFMMFLGFIPTGDYVYVITAPDGTIDSITEFQIVEPSDAHEIIHEETDYSLS